ncbi:hypothetical protein [Novosphingobium sp. EMRT-2]|uniref:hypothetical protein n=1 Tax=Novosphingobium sp. EMRT-2 TaxID=2571749 RepID=UPI0010BDC02E|nr:hypothetical protein [Novosphingobium sp. EMRT-2]QCI92290.1 hypothetical protein FA702_01045 [Novosphingobium sp. EMRT-2]
MTTPGQYLRLCREATKWSERQIAERLCALPEARVVTPALIVQLAWRLHQAEEDQASLTSYQAALVERVLPGFTATTYREIWLAHLQAATMASRRASMDRFEARVAEDIRAAVERMFTEAFAKPSRSAR